MEYESRWTLLSLWPNAKGWCHLTLDLWNEVSLNKTHTQMKLNRDAGWIWLHFVSTPSGAVYTKRCNVRSGLAVIQYLQSNNTARSVSVFLSHFCLAIIKRAPDRILHCSLKYDFRDFLVRLVRTEWYAHCDSFSRTGFNVFGFLGALDA